MIITIDGPAGAGKSTVAKLIAKKLSFTFLDTGAMYRAFTFKAMKGGISWDNEEALVNMTRASKLEMMPNRVILDGVDITGEIRKNEVTKEVFHIADMPAIRAELVRSQREFAKMAGNIVTEGRDQGTVVFPDAEVKFFLTASVDERARRRLLELNAKGAKVNLEEIKKEIIERDKKDQTRQVGALRKAEDAKEIDTTNMTIQDVVAKIFACIIK